MPQHAYIVTPSEYNLKLVDFLSARQACSLRKAKTLLDERCVFVNGHRVWMAKHPLKSGDEVEVAAGMSDQAKRIPQTLSILFRNDAYIIINKPAGLVSNGPDSAETLLREQTGNPGLQAAHRLDRDTSGCLLFASSAEAFTRVVARFKEQFVSKVYHAIVAGSVARETTIRKALEDREAVTHIRPLEYNDTASHLQIKIDTGRTHQIRKHLASIRHPVLGDRQYMTGRLDDPRFRSVPRQMLHASHLRVTWPGAEPAMDARATFPSDYQATLKKFRLI